MSYQSKLKLKFALKVEDKKYSLDSAKSLYLETLHILKEIFHESIFS